MGSSIQRCAHFLLAAFLFWLLAPGFTTTSSVNAQPVMKREAQTDDPLAWFIGNWSVSYQDRHLGEVKGYAVVKTNAFEPTVPFVKVTLKDPGSEREYTLSATRVSIRDGVLHVELWGASPSKAKTVDGEATISDGEIITIPRQQAGLDAKLTATYGLISTEKAIKPLDGREGSIKISFPLPQPAGQIASLDGTWKARRNPTTGFIDLRTGQLDATKQWMSNSESWKRDAITITNVTPVTLRDFGYFVSYRNRENTLLQDFWLCIEGTGLPIRRGESCVVEFADEHIKYLNDHKPDPNVEGALQIKCALHRGIQPGPKSFTLNGAPGRWQFDFPGNEPNAARFIRKLDEHVTEPIETAYHGELVYVELEFEHEPFYDDRTMAIIPQGQMPVRFRVVKGQGEAGELGQTNYPKNVFRSTTSFLLLPTWEEEPDESSFQGDANYVESSLHRGRPVTVRAKMDSALRTMVIDAITDPRTLPVGIATVAHRPPSEWERAMKKARKCFAEHPERYVDTSRFVNPVETWGRKATTKSEVLLSLISAMPVRERSTHMTVEDHAACILLYDELRKRLLRYSSEVYADPPRTLQGEMHPKYQQGQDQLIQGLLHLADNGGQHPLLLFDVTNPDTGEKEPLDNAIDSIKLRQRYGNDQAAMTAYVRKAVREAQRASANAACDSYGKLGEIGTNEPIELLKAVGLGYESVAHTVARRLFRYSDVTLGEPFYPEWVPDKRARLAIKTLGILVQNFKAEEAYSDFSRDYTLMIATLPLMAASLPAALATRAGLAVSTGAQAAARISSVGMAIMEYGVGAAIVGDSVVKWQSAEEMKDLARGTAGATGDVNPFFMRAEEEDAAFWNMVTTAGMSYGPQIFGQAVARGLRPGRKSMKMAAEKVMRRGLSSLNPQERAAFDFLSGRAAHRIARGGQALDELDRLAIRSQYPDGIPPELARQIGIDPAILKNSPGETTITSVEEPTITSTGEITVTMDGHRTNGGRFDPDATLAEPMRNDLLTPADDIRPQDSSNPVIRDLYRRAAGEASHGNLDAVGRQRKLETMEREWQRLPPDTQGRVLEAMEIFRRLRSESPQLANLDPAEAMRMMTFHARGSQPGSLGANALTPQDLVARVAAWNKTPLDNAQLARASNGPMLEAEIATGQARRWADRFNGDGSPRPREARTTTASSSARAGDTTWTLSERPDGARGRRPPSTSESNAPTNTTEPSKMAVRSQRDFQPIRESDVTNPTRITRRESRPPPQYQPVRQNNQPMPASYPDGGTFKRAERQVQQELERLGIDPRNAAMQSVGPAARGVDPKVAAVGQGFKDFKSPAFLRKPLGLSDAEMRSALDEYLRRVDLVRDPARRQQLMDEFFRREHASTIIEPSPSAPRPDVNAPEASRAASAANARKAAIARDLERMGMHPLGARLNSAVAAGRGVDPPAAAAGAAFDRAQGPSVLRQRLGMSDSQIRSSLNDYLEKVRFVNDTAERRELIDKFMRQESANTGMSTITDPPPSVSGSRTDIDGLSASGHEADIYRLIRDLGRNPIDAQLHAAIASSRGLDLRTAGVGSVFDDFSKGPAFLRERMNLTNGEIRNALDEFLQRVRQVDNVAERKRVIDRFMRRDDPTLIDSRPDRPRPPGDTTLPPPRPYTIPEEAGGGVYVGRDGNPVSREEFVSQVERTLGQLVDNADAVRQLDLDYLVGQHNLNADEIIAITGMALEVNPRALQAHLGARDAQFGRMLDRGFRILNPEMGSLRRADQIGNYLRAGGIREGSEIVFEGRNAALRDAMRAMNADRIDMLGVYRGLEVETAAAGQAFHQYIGPERLRQIPGMSDEAIRRHLDQYLRMVNDVSDPTRRASLIDDYLAGNHRPPTTPPPLLIEQPKALPKATAEDIVRSLEQVGLTTNDARALADDLWDVAWHDPYQALVAAAYRRGIPANQLESLGLNREQVVRLLDQHLQNHAQLGGMRQRAQAIAENYLGPTEGQAFTANEVLRLLASPEGRPPSASTYRPPRAEEVVRAELNAAVAPIDPLADTAWHAHTPFDESSVTANLDEQFGRVNEPQGWGLKRHEVAAGGRVLENPEKLVLDGQTRLPTLDPQKRYIWVVDEQGRLIFGAATPVQIGPDGMVQRLGHPSLTNNGPARIAGELVWSEADGAWVINNRGGRYSAHADMNVSQLQRVGGLFENAGLENFGVRFDRASNPWASRDQ